MRTYFRDNNLIVFLCNNEVCDIDFFDKDGLESYFRKLFLKLNNYGYDFNGSYTISVFIDDAYGIVLDIVKDDVEFYELYDSIDMNICVSKEKGFLYRVDFFIDKIDGNYYTYNGGLYFEPNCVSFIDLGFLIENSEIIYGKDCENVKCFGSVVDYVFE